MSEFVGFPKVPRMFREVVITEKIDGTNAQVYIVPLNDWRTHHGTAIDVDYDRGMAMYAGSRKRYITPDNDNFGFARWAEDNAEELYGLGPGRHYGEWWGKGIQRGYDLDERRFSLFNTGRWTDNWVDEPDKEVVPECCHVVPVLAEGNPYSDNLVRGVLGHLEHYGSEAAPGFMHPEGIMLYHTAADQTFKVTIKNDHEHKGITMLGIA